MDEFHQRRYEQVVKTEGDEAASAYGGAYITMQEFETYLNVIGFDKSNIRFYIQRPAIEEGMKEFLTTPMPPYMFSMRHLSGSDTPELRDELRRLHAGFNEWRGTGMIIPLDEVYLPFDFHALAYGYAVYRYEMGITASTLKFIPQENERVFYLSDSGEQALFEQFLQEVVADQAELNSWLSQKPYKIVAARPHP